MRVRIIIIIIIKKPYKAFLFWEFLILFFSFFAFTIHHIYSPRKKKDNAALFLSNI